MVRIFVGGCPKRDSPLLLFFFNIILFDGVSTMNTDLGNHKKTTNDRWLSHRKSN